MVWGPQNSPPGAGQAEMSSVVTMVGYYSGGISFKCLLVSWKFYTLSVTHQGSNSSQKSSYESEYSSPSFI